MSSSLLFECFDSFPLDAREYVHLPQSVTHLFLEKLFVSSSSSLLHLLAPSDDREFFLQFFKSRGIPVFFFPFYDLLPYEDGIPNPTIVAHRLKTLHAIMNQTRGIYLIPLKSFLFGVPGIKVLKEELSHSFYVGEHFDRTAWTQRLTEWQYTRVPSVDAEGQFSLKGELLETWDPVLSQILRIHLSYDVIEKISLHDAKARSHGTSVESQTLYACKDFLYTPERHQTFIESLKLEKNPLQIQDFQDSVGEAQITHLIPFFYQTSLLNLFQTSSHPLTLTVSNLLEIEGQERRYLREIKELFGSSFNYAKMMLPPSAYYFSLSSLIKDFPSTLFLSPFKPIDESQEPSNKVVEVSKWLKAAPSYQGKIELLPVDLEKYPDFTTYILADSETVKDKMSMIFPHIQMLTDSSLKNGIIDLVHRRIFFTEQDLFGKFSSLKKKTDFLKDSSPIDHFSELSVGDYIVHIHHGVGIYQGIQKMPIMGTQKDYIKIAYADEEILYTPIEQIFLVHKYMGSVTPAIHHLGGKKWEQKKAKVIQSLEDMSEDLVVLYESRKKLMGFSFPTDTPFQEEFEREFPYEATEGQLQATQDIKKDMESSLVMDRLVCGDVGYGKTEVAFRAVFKAVSAGKQVAFLAPTTLLVEQHYHSMIVRFSQFPIRIALLSRTVPSKEQKQIIQDLQDGLIDVVVGTHALFSQKIHFQNLGLLVIDEEQRFGVKHKEKIKDENPLVDTLVLSATPIPRTLHMGLSSFRDMSLITTPPIARLPIKTYVMPFNEEILISSIRRELERGGQVFIIHNRVSTISFFGSFIQKLLPEARVAIGHAQMSTKEMEQIFIDFIAHKTDILISTTIVENGIDIANANTIIIDKPELLGLGELYQLRGRVGRGQRQGYAYLLYDPIAGLSLATQQRLQTIEEHTTLGSGFQIAMRDLEIRGAGNLLGKAQSGLFNEIGMSLYGQILRKVVHKIKGHEEQDVEPIMDLPFDGRIPENYISEDRNRFQFYKVLMQSKTFEELKNIEDNATQSYGPIPTTMKNLFRVAQIKILARTLAIKELRCRDKVYEIYFVGQPKIHTPALAPLIQDGKARILSTTAIKIDQFLLYEDLLEDLLEHLKRLLGQESVILQTEIAG